jgi:hypothetical protein
MILALPLQLVAVAIDVATPDHDSETDSHETVWIEDERSGLHILAELGDNDDVYVCTEDPIQLDNAR